MPHLGKHRGRKFEDVAQSDRGYCAWVLREKALPLHGFYRCLINVHGGILNFGKHKGRFFDGVLDGAPEYCDWALGLEGPSASLMLFIDYARVHHRKETVAQRPAQDPPHKKTRTNEKACVICFDRHINSAFVPCGHLVSCLPYASKFDGKQCPMCKQQVAMVLKTYPA